MKKTLIILAILLGINFLITGICKTFAHDEFLDNCKGGIVLHSQPLEK